MREPVPSLPGKLVDYEHPLVSTMAHELTDGSSTIEGKVEKIFYFVRDEIKFHFPPKGDFVKASETLQTKLGQCNTKGTLFLALCKAVGIPARLHFSLINKEIQKGFFSGLSYWLIPNEISHSWIEVEINEKWHRIDAYINDQELHSAAVNALNQRGWKTGFSVSLSDSPPQSKFEFQLGDEQFEQMGAVTGDHGVWDDPSAYYASDKYKNRPKPIQLMIYHRMIARANRRIAELRETY